MTRNLKVLGLVLVAVLAMSAVVASSALAAAGEFNGEAGTARLTAMNESGTEDKFVTDAGEIHCETTTAEGNVVALPAKTFTFPTVAYDTCKGPLNVNVTVDMNGCGYKFTANPLNAEGNFEGSAAIVGCTNAIKAIEVTAPGCTITVPEAGNGNLTKVTYTNKGAGANREITADIGINNITYKEDNAGIIHTCKHAGETTVGGSYTGSETVTGETTASPPVMKGIFVE